MWQYSTAQPRSRRKQMVTSEKSLSHSEHDSDDSLLVVSSLFQARVIKTTHVDYGDIMGISSGYNGDILGIISLSDLQRICLRKTLQDTMDFCHRIMGVSCVCSLKPIPWDFTIPTNIDPENCPFEEDGSLPLNHRSLLMKYKDLISLLLLIQTIHKTIYWLVVSTPLKNISQLGWWNSQYMEKHVPNNQPDIWWLTPRQVNSSGLGSRGSRDFVPTRYARRKRSPEATPRIYPKWSTGVYITNWKDPPCYLAGKIHYFDWVMASIANCECLPEIDCHRKNVRVYVRKNVRMSGYVYIYIWCLLYFQMICQKLLTMAEWCVRVGITGSIFFIETVHFFMVSQSVNTLKHGECNKSNIMLPDWFNGILIIW